MKGAAGLTIESASDDFVFAALVASFGMLLQGSQHSADLTFDSVHALPSGAIGQDPFGYRGDFLNLVAKASAIANQAASPTP